MRSTIRLAFVLVVLAILGFIPNVSVAAATTTGVAAYRLEGTVRGLVEPETVGDPQEALPYANETVSITGGYSGTTGEDGGWVIEVPEDGDYPGTTRLRGLYVDVYRDDGMPEAVLSFLAQPGDPVALLFDDAGSHIAERDAYFHINAIHGWIKKADPNFTALDTPLAVHVNNPNGSCGAFWWQGGLVFFSEGSGCNNTARISDVVYHEYAHGITRALYAPDPAPVSSGMDEAYSDIAAMTIHDDPEIGENFLETGGYIRTGENLRQYPGTECGGDIFCRSEILSGAMWKVRKNLDLLYGPEAAAPIFDDLHVRTMKEKPTQMPEFLLRLLANDDNDGDLTNGTPHWHEICDAFALHNLPCPALDPASVDTDPHGAQATGRPGDLLALDGANPARASFRIRFAPRDVAGRTATVIVYDAAGRLVRRLFEGAAGLQSQVLVWDGRDDDGQEVGSGVYFARARAGSRTSTQTLVLTR